MYSCSGLLSPCTGRRPAWSCPARAPAAPPPRSAWCPAGWSRSGGRRAAPRPSGYRQVSIILTFEQLEARWSWSPLCSPDTPGAPPRSRTGAARGAWRSTPRTPAPGLSTYNFTYSSSYDSNWQINENMGFGEKLNNILYYQE